MDHVRNAQDVEVETTRIVVKLAAHGVRLVARSEAKRLANGLERFKHVVLDFQGVEGVGQGFADELLRVWAKANPDVQITVENMSAPVEFMVERARRARLP